MFVVYVRNLLYLCKILEETAKKTYFYVYGRNERQNQTGNGGSAHDPTDIRQLHRNVAGIA